MEFLTSVLSYFKTYLPISIDILILSMIIYYIYKYVAETNAVFIIRGFFVVCLLYAVSYFFKLKTLTWVLKYSMPAIIILIFIMIQPQIRKVLLEIGNLKFFNSNIVDSRAALLDEIIFSCEYLALKKRGALIVFERENSLKTIIDSGIKINSSVKKELINSIFEYNTQLHDGALIIDRNAKIAAAACVLPLSNRNETKYVFGTRHRAAIGITENNDCVTLIVSEENGFISIAFNGSIYYNLKNAEIKNQLLSFIKNTNIKESL